MGVQKDQRLIDLAEANEIESIRLLFKLGIDVNSVGYYGGAPGYTALMIAVIHGHTKLVKFLLDRSNIDVNAANHYKLTALRLASNYGRTEIVGFLLRTPEIDVNKQDVKGDTALIIAAASGYSDIVQKLLSFKGILVNRTNNLGYSALHRAAMNNEKEVVELLLQMPGIWVNQQCKEHLHSPLHMVVHLRSSDLVRLLLSHPDINVNIVNKHNQTPLIFACHYGQQETVRLLLAAGADVIKKTNSGRTALDYTKQEGNIECEIIIENQMKINNIKIDAASEAFSKSSQPGFRESFDELKEARNLLKDLVKIIKFANQVIKTIYRL